MNGSKLHQECVRFTYKVYVILEQSEQSENEEDESGVEVEDDDDERSDEEEEVNLLKHSISYCELLLNV